MAVVTIGRFDVHDGTTWQLARVQAVVDNCTFNFSLLLGQIDIYFLRNRDMPLLETGEGHAWGYEYLTGSRRRADINNSLSVAETEYAIAHELGHFVDHDTLNAGLRTTLDNNYLKPDFGADTWRSGPYKKRASEGFANAFAKQLYIGGGASWSGILPSYYQRKFVSGDFNAVRSIVETGTSDNDNTDTGDSGSGAVEFVATKDVARRSRVGKSVKQGAGLEQHLPMGFLGDTTNAAPDWLHDALIQFNLDWPAGAEVITEASLELTITADPTDPHLSASGDKSALLAARVLKTWTEGNKGEGAWHADDWRDPLWATTLRNLGPVGQKPLATRVSFDILPFIHEWAPDTIKVGTLGSGKGLANFGLYLRVVKQDKITGATVFASQDNGNSAWRPTIYVVYTTAAATPVGFTSAPIGTINTNIFAFTGEYEDPKGEDHLGAYEMQVRKAGGVTVWTPAVEKADANGAINGTFSKPSADAPPNTWVVGQDYEWRVRVQSAISGKWSDWTAWQAFVISNSAPTALATALGTKATLDNTYFGGTFSNPGGLTILNCQIQLRLEAQGDPSWAGIDGFLWDTGEQPLSAAEKSAATVKRLYGGSKLTPATYTYRVRVQDDGGAWSAWSYATITLSVGYQPDPGAYEFLSGYGRQKMDRRIMLRHFTTGRGPGTVKAIIYDAANIGASIVANDTGEFYFTVPTTHPQVSEIEPLQTHYALEFYRAGEWRPVFEGLITDMDAQENDVVFYGIDYLGLLSKSVETAFYNWNSPEAEITSGGAKYLDKNISFVIKDQLARAQATTDSPVGFISVEAQGQSTLMEPISEKVSIHAEFRERLGFILGLIQSAKQGTGKRSRLWVERAASGSYRWRYKNNAGANRDNLRLKYGELVQGFRLVLLGNWAAKVYGVGRITNEVKLRFHSESAPGIDTAIWGNFQMPAIWQDLVDENDLKRRVRQLAIEMGKFGKSVALGLRVAGLEPLDGFDLCDNIPIEIVRGAVDTTRYGSGYWTILGVEYRLFPDGHDELTLAVKPREDDVAPNPDLIPSLPVSTAPEWTRLGLVGANLVASTSSRIRQDGTSSPLVSATWNAITNEGFGTWAVQVARNGAGDFTSAPIFSTATSAIEIEDLAPAQDYSIRVGAFDTGGNFSGFTAHVVVTAASDVTPPTIPANVGLTPSIRSLFVGWDGAPEADLSHYEVNWRPTGDTDWSSLLTKGTDIAITGLSAVQYEVRVRSFDLTGNGSSWSATVTESPFFVRGADVTPGAIGTNQLADGAATNPKIGPLAVGEPNLADNSIRARHILVGQIDSGHINVNGLDANVIKTGTLKVGGAGNPPDFIVYNSLGQEIVHFSEAGAVFTDPLNVLRRMRYVDGTLEFTTDGVTWTTAINADGITATAIRVGVAPGGHNLIPNSSFENRAFIGLNTKKWTVTGDWTATIGTDVNVDKTTGDLKLGSVTY